MDAKVSFWIGIVLLTSLIPIMVYMVYLGSWGWLIFDAMLFMLNTKNVLFFYRRSYGC
jgi:hypothetical protein